MNDHQSELRWSLQRLIFEAQIQMGGETKHLPNALSAQPCYNLFERKTLVTVPPPLLNLLGRKPVTLVMG